MRPEAFELPLRIVVKAPVPGVAMAMQRGASAKATLIEPVQASADSLIFDFDVAMNGAGADGAPRLLGWSSSFVLVRRLHPGHSQARRTGGLRMGQKCSWVAVQGKARAAVLEQLRMSETGREDPYHEGPFCCADLPSGWALVYGNEMDWATPEMIAELSAGGAAVGCQMYEVVMYSRAWGFRDGVQQWSIEHSPEDGKMLEVEGEPPPEFAAIRDAAEREQALEGEGVDFIFDVPVALTGALCGFRPDEDGPEPLPTFYAAGYAGRDEGPSIIDLFRKLFSRRS